MGNDSADPPPSHRVRMLGLPRTATGRMVRHLSDLLSRFFPQTAHTRSGLVVPIHDRTERRIYERMFVEDMFPLGDHAHLMTSAVPIVADIGAHVGMFALSVADWFPQARMHLFEPVPRHAARAEALAKLNGLSAFWQVHRAVVGNQSGPARLHCPGSRLGATLLASKAGGMGGCRRTLDVPMVRLDDHMAQHALDHFDIVKIDAEGCEYAAIASSRMVMDKAILVFVRVFPPHSTWEGVDALLTTSGLCAVGRVDPGHHEHLWVRGGPPSHGRGAARS